MAGAYRVLLTEGAEHDLDAIYDYIAESDETSNADYVLSRLMATAEQLSTFPDRGSYPRELLNIGIKEYRQVFFKPYRLIYRIVGKQVVVYMIADSRRDLQSLLARRLLGSR
ncbi:MAG: type II toxin-antitoxin system RelE/ParE family toxin [Burkholderiaceae bacterium]